MPPTVHRLPRALLLSVGLHLGLGVWLWTRSEPEAPPAAVPLQVPVTLQFVEVEVPSPPPKAAPPSPGIRTTTPARPAPASRSPRGPPTSVPDTTESLAPPGAQGGVHPYFSTLGRSMLQHWNPEQFLSVMGFTGSFGMNPSAYKEVAQAVSEHAGVNAPTLESDKRALRQKTKQQLRVSRHTTVRVLHDASGKVRGVHVASTSHDRNLDVVAATSVQRAAELQQLPSPKVFQGRELWVSLWRLELIVSENPPAPSAGLTFDEEAEHPGLHLPPGQHLYKRVRLLEVR
ncbi:MAG: hypothetical protein ABW123_29465 [Cystobacter sp.]